MRLLILIVAAEVSKDCGLGVPGRGGWASVGGSIEGEFRNGKPHGHGTMVWRMGAVSSRAGAEAGA